MKHRSLRQVSADVAALAPYAGPAIFFHWLMFAMILVAFPLGLYMHGLALSPDKLRLYSYHKWMGVTLFVLALARLGFRRLHAPPGLPISLPTWEKRLAQTAHGLLYAFLLAVPLSGWLMSSAMGFQTVWFGLMPLPDLMAKNKEAASLLKQFHQGLNYLMVLLILLHATAALTHHFRRRDEVLQRMWPWLRRQRHPKGLAGGDDGAS